MGQEEIRFSLPNQFPAADVQAYEIYLQFVNDEEGIVWREWWNTEGHKSFQIFYAKWGANNANEV